MLWALPKPEYTALGPIVTGSEPLKARRRSSLTICNPCWPAESATMNAVLA